MELRLNQIKTQKILMVGPDLSFHGGVAEFQRIYLSEWNATGYSIKHVGTVKRGTKVRKFATAAGALVQFIGQTITWKPDLIHVHFSVSASFYRKALFIIIAKFFGKPVIMHSHAPNFDAFFSRSGALSQQFILYILRRAELIIAVSESWRRYFAALLPNVRIVRIYNSLPPPNLPVASIPAIGTPYILFLGQLCERKGTADLLDAFEIVARDFDDVELWLAGDCEVDRIEERVAQSIYKDRIRLLGYIVNVEKDRILDGATVFCLPSYAEGLPLAILEAMAFAKPIVSTSVGGIPELVDDGKSGYLTEPGDVEQLANKISQLLRDRHSRKLLGLAARRRFEAQFSIGTMMRGHLKAYQSVFSGQGIYSA
jgi:glycosyltransferase involved in cell wall biosynthesis